MKPGRAWLLAGLLAATGVPAIAAPVEITTKLTFDGLADGQQVGSTFSGITFGDRAVASIDRDVVDSSGFPLGSGNFANEPSPDAVLAFQYDPDSETDRDFLLTIQVAEGFNSRFSLYYSLPRTSASVVLKDALGQQLASVQLSNTAPGVGDPTGGDFGSWSFVDIALSAGQVATTVELRSKYGRVLFDDLTFTSVVPEPASAALLAAGLLAVGGLARRRPA